MTNSVMTVAIWLCTVKVNTARRSARGKQADENARRQRPVGELPPAQLPTTIPTPNTARRLRTIEVIYGRINEVGIPVVEQVGSGPENSLAFIQNDPAVLTRRARRPRGAAPTGVTTVALNRSFPRGSAYGEYDQWAAASTQVSS